MTFPSKPQPVFGLERSHRGPSGQYRGGREDRDWLRNDPWPSWGHSLALRRSPALTVRPAPGPAQPGKGGRGC